MVVGSCTLMFTFTLIVIVAAFKGLKLNFSLRTFHNLINFKLSQLLIFIRTDQILLNQII